MKLSVIIPACNRPDRLRECLRALGSPDGAETIVTDDSHSSDVRRLVETEFPRVRWIPGPRRGPASNRNHGAREAAGDWLVFLDDDCLPAPGWLAAMERAALTDRFDVLEGRTECPREDSLAPLEIVENLAGGAFWSCNLAVRRTVFEQLRGFDEDFPHACGEDVEFAWRIRQRGLRTAFAADAAVTHPPRPMGLRALIRRTAAHRWMLLCRLKTVPAPPLDASPVRAAAALCLHEFLDCLRLLARLPRPTPHFQARLFHAIWRTLSLPFFLPGYILWDWRFRAMLRNREQI